MIDDLTEETCAICGGGDDLTRLDDGIVVCLNMGIDQEATKWPV